MTEYQHFIPQFILRNFAYPFVCPDTPPRAKRCKRRHHEKNKYPGDLVMRCLSLERSGLVLEESPVKRACGLFDMYNGTGVTRSKRCAIEKAFGRLESKASAICWQIIKKHEKKEPFIAFTRVEKNTLRKFLILMGLRNEQFYRRYNRPLSEYDEDDRELMESYIARNRLESPLDVWLQSLGEIINLDMDPEENWKTSIMSKVYVPIALDFVDIYQEMDMAIVTPEAADQEFILTDNCYNVSEGRTYHFKDKLSGDAFSTGPNFHLFAPLSPKLMLVTRSTELPDPTNPRTEHISMRQVWRAVDPTLNVESLLEYLPVTRPRASYVHAGWAEMGMKPPYSQNDRFEFPFFRISTEHMHIINGLLVDHAFHGSRIIFNQRQWFLNLIEWYLEEPCQVGKNIVGKHADLQTMYIKRLCIFMAKQGYSDIRGLVYFHEDREVPPYLHRDLRESWLRMLDPHEREPAQDDVQPPPLATELTVGESGPAVDINETIQGEADIVADPAFRQCYEKLGGDALDSDLAESTLMFKCWETAFMRDGTTPRYLCRNFFEFPCPVFWLFLKKMRVSKAVMAARGSEGVGQSSIHNRHSWRGEEDKMIFQLSGIRAKRLNEYMFIEFFPSYERMRNDHNAKQCQQTLQAQLGHMFGSPLSDRYVRVHSGGRVVAVKSRRPVAARGSSILRAVDWARSIPKWVRIVLLVVTMELIIHGYFIYRLSVLLRYWANRDILYIKHLEGRFIDYCDGIPIVSDWIAFLRRHQTLAMIIYYLVARFFGVLPPQLA